MTATSSVLRHLLRSPDDRGSLNATAAAPHRGMAFSPDASKTKKESCPYAASGLTLEVVLSLAVGFKPEPSYFFFFFFYFLTSDTTTTTTRTRHMLHYLRSDCAPAGAFAVSQVADTTPLIAPLTLPVCDVLIEIAAVVASASDVVLPSVAMPRTRLLLTSSGCCVLECIQCAAGAPRA